MKMEKFLVIYVREEEFHPGLYDVFFSDDGEKDPWRGQSLTLDEAINCATRIIEKNPLGGDVIIETNDGKARLLWPDGRNNHQD